tara:strand:+ start:852 stop:1403 length:552 start_codon:yes stop_codon:yes gene_type:complete
MITTQSLHIIKEEWIGNYITYDDVIHNRDIDPYADSSFKPIKDLSSKRKGRFFEVLTEEYCENLGFIIDKPKNSDHDSIINGKKVEIKGSFRWVVDGELKHYRWQQIRPSQDYEVMIFLAIDPNNIRFYGANKKEVADFVTVRDSDGNYPYNQHGGMTVNSGTYRIDGYPKDYPFMRSITEFL